MKSTLLASILAVAGLVLTAGCATEHSRTLDTPKPPVAATVYQGQKPLISVGKFDNRSSFMNGIFSDGVDRLGSQAKTILITHLQQSGRFNVLERDNMAEAAQEAHLMKKAQTIIGARYVLTGDVTEFGRKEVGDQQLFGILGRGKQQIAYAKVSLNLVDVQTSAVIVSSQGAGEYSLSQREVVGFGGTSSYDATLNGKVLDLAIREAVSKLAQAVEQGTIKP
ncbi:MAG TPA: CsgG/HfaB family protein [Cellvibrionaceae bacterium]